MYSLIAEQYSSLFPPDEHRCSFILDEIHSKDTPSPRILDAGCATGDLSFELADSGCMLTGIDLDTEMIKIAKTRANGYKNGKVCPEFRVGSLTNIKKYGRFDSVICFGNTLPHLPLEDDVLHFFTETATILTPGGRLIFQIINFDLLEGKENFDFLDIETEGSTFKRRYQKRADGRIDFIISLTAQKNGTALSDSVPLLPLRRNVIADMLVKAGFRDINIYKGYDRIPSDGSEFASIYSASQ